MEERQPGVVHDGVDISLMVGEGEVNLVVSDNGVGMPGHGGSRSGLDNLARRAERLGGG
ncbi:hypothetical protein [Streptomyces sp. NPDC102437]|uniref:hypothetical protein n=1 Tax=Streptomyces sp. NPDC102437 TaxID=3366175 RepID=UPI0037F8FD78